MLFASHDQQILIYALMGGLDHAIHIQEEIVNPLHCHDSCHRQKKLLWELLHGVFDNC